MRVQGSQHALNGSLNHLALFSLCDVVGLDPAQHVPEQLKLPERLRMILLPPFGCDSYGHCPERESQD